MRFVTQIIVVVLLVGTAINITVPGMRDGGVWLGVGIAVSSYIVLQFLRRIVK